MAAAVRELQVPAPPAAPDLSASLGGDSTAQAGDPIFSGTGPRSVSFMEASAQPHFGQRLSVQPPPSAPGSRRPSTVPLAPGAGGAPRQGSQRASTGAGPRVSLSPVKVPGSRRSVGAGREAGPAAAAPGATLHVAPSQPLSPQKRLSLSQLPTPLQGSALRQQRGAPQGPLSWDELPLQQLRDAFRRRSSATLEAGRPPRPEDYQPMEIDEFVDKFGTMLGRSAKELRTTFMRIDANANGSIDWDELSNFLLLNQAIASGRDGKPSVEPDSTYDEDYREGAAELIAQQGKFVEHTDTVCKVIVHPRYPRYVTAGQDGMVKYWHSGTLAHERTVHNGKAWVTDMLYAAPHGNSPNDHIVVAGIDRVVSVYEGNSGDLVKSFKGKRARKGGRKGLMRREVVMREDFTIPTRPHASSSKMQDGRPPGAEPSAEGQGQHSTLLAHFKRMRPVEMVLLEHLETIPWALGHYSFGYQERLLIGTDDTGTHPGGARIYMYNLAENTTLTDKVSIPCINSKGGAYGWPTGHKGGITRLVVADRMEGIITSGQDATIRILHLERGTNQRVLGTAHEVDITRPAAPRGLGGQPLGLNILQQGGDDTLDVTGEGGHRKPVHNFAWCDDRKLLASCGTERDVLVWNPFITKPVAKLAGHRTPMIDVVFNPQDNQIITLSSDKMVKVWDLRTYQCTQTLRDKHRYRPEDRLGALGYDARRSAIITASNRPHVRPMIRNFSEFAPNYHGHRKEVVGACYSLTFRQLVTADELHIYVWDLDTLQPVVGWEVPQGVTGLCFDNNERRLICGTRAGDTLMWNYVNAQLLKTCLGTTCTVTGEDGKKRKMLLEGASPGEATNCFFFEHERGGRVASSSPIAPRTIACIFAHRSVLLYEDTEDAQEAFYRDVAVPTDPPYGGVFSVCCVPAFSALVLGCGSGGVAVTILDQTTAPSKPVLLKRLQREGPPWLGLLDGPLHEDVPHCVRPGAVYVELKPVDSIVEQVLTLPRAPRIVISARGDGCISFWDVDLFTGEGLGEMFCFQATHEQGESVYALATDEAQGRLFTGDVAGYVHTYDIGRISDGGPPEGVAWADALQKLSGFRAHRGGVSELKHLPVQDLLLVAGGDCIVQLVTPEGLVACRIGETAPRPAPRMSMMAGPEPLLALGMRSQWQRHPLPHSPPAQQSILLYRKADLVRALASDTSGRGMNVEQAAAAVMRLTKGRFLTLDGADWSSSSDRAREEGAEALTHSVLRLLCHESADGPPLVTMAREEGDTWYSADRQRITDLGGVDYPSPRAVVESRALLWDQRRRSSNPQSRQTTESALPQRQVTTRAARGGAEHGAHPGAPPAPSIGRRLLEPLPTPLGVGQLSPRRRMPAAEDNPLVVPRESRAPPSASDQSSHTGPDQSPGQRPPATPSASSRGSLESPRPPKEDPATAALRRRQQAALKRLLMPPAPPREGLPRRCRYAQTARHPAGFGWHSCGSSTWAPQRMGSPRSHRSRSGSEGSESEEETKVFWRTDPAEWQRPKRPVQVCGEAAELRLGLVAPAPQGTPTTPATDSESQPAPPAPGERAAEAPAGHPRLSRAPRQQRSPSAASRASAHPHAASGGTSPADATQRRRVSVSPPPRSASDVPAADAPARAPAKKLPHKVVDPDKLRADEARQWYLKARREHPPTKRRHRKYEVREQPLRAHHLLCIQEVVTPPNPRRSHRPLDKVPAAGARLPTAGAT
eukprot:TRINITY_DN17117_c0_g1_i1.p1 TRINITY_DN17117_c0_g1~~TRINITY_DN17117_c0_g1_i1.p1  ORF type:complete len:1742 (+),score=524.11 TRINITY_DN17117_c0_g1_i1:80-5227(+)